MKSKIDAKVNAKVKTNGEICSLSDVNEISLVIAKWKRQNGLMDGFHLFPL